jgi:hypothetical protein
VQLRSPNASHNLRAMQRLLFGLCSGAALLALACNDELVETVPQDVCYSEMRWIGGKRGSPEMYPGDDCVGCHIENDGPPLALGGTLYPFVMGGDQLAELQSGEHCFGIEGITITIEDADGQVFEVVTNRAGNFYVEGNPADFAKGFNVSITDYTVDENGQPAGQTGMLTSPMYGGCARCHNPEVPPNIEDYNTTPTDAEYRNGAPRIGLPGYSVNGLGTPTVVQELEALVNGDTEQ